MTTEAARASFAPWRLTLVCLLFACAGTTRSRQGDSVDVSSYPPDIQRAYDTFAVRCSRCHTLARPLNANIRDPQHWRRYVARMRRTPGSGINAQNANIILRFLLYYTEHEKAEANSAPPAPAVVEPGAIPPDAGAGSGAASSDGGQP